MGLFLRTQEEMGERGGEGVGPIAETNEKSLLLIRGLEGGGGGGGGGAYRKTLISATALLFASS